MNQIRESIMDQRISEWAEMRNKVSCMTNSEIQLVWDNLKHYDSSEMYQETISMDSWAEYIYSEMDRRSMQH